MNTPNTPINEAFARLSMLELLLEIIVANEMARHEPAHSEAWKANFVQRFEAPLLGPIPATTEAEQTEAWIAERSAQMAARLMERVAGREAQIRKHHRGLGV